MERAKTYWQQVFPAKIMTLILRGRLVKAWGIPLFKESVETPASWGGEYWSAHLHENSLKADIALYPASSLGKVGKDSGSVSGGVAPFKV